MAFKVRRFVTGLNDQGRSCVTHDDTVENVMAIAGWPGAYISEIWTTDEIPVDNRGAADRGARPIRHDPTPNGTIFRVVEIPPDGFEGGIDTAAAFAAMGSRNKPSAVDQQQHGTMHFTNSIDYLIVLEGEMHMVMEDGEVLLPTGSVVVQRGTKHAWVNRSGKPCVIAAILVDAQPLAA
jgi:mannose-6-phosphate isomerase-like protein (cupin superfamily)